MSRYTASIIGGQNIIFKPYIDISSDSVKFKVPGFFSGEEQTLSIDSITEIGISGSIISKTITIYTTGLGSIHAEGFSPSDAKAIEREIESNRKERQRKKLEQHNSYREQREPESDAQLKKKEFTNIDLIPLISFSHYPPQLFTDMNALLHYAEAELNAKDFDSYARNKVEAYIRKLEEGERVADGLDLNTDYLRREKDVVSAGLWQLKEGRKARTGKKRNRKIIKWAIWIIVILYIWKHFR